MVSRVPSICQHHRGQQTMPRSLIIAATCIIWAVHTVLVTSSPTAGPTGGSCKGASCKSTPPGSGAAQVFSVGSKWHGHFSCAAYARATLTIRSVDDTTLEGHMQFIVPNLNVVGSFPTTGVWHSDDRQLDMRGVEAGSQLPAGYKVLPPMKLFMTLDGHALHGSVCGKPILLAPEGRRDLLLLDRHGMDLFDVEVSLKDSQGRDKGGTAAPRKVLYMSAQNRVTKRLYTGEMSQSGLLKQNVHRTISAAQKLLVTALRGTSEAVTLVAGFPEQMGGSQISKVDLASVGHGRTSPDQSAGRPAEATSVLLARPTNSSTDPLVLRVRYVSEFDDVSLEFKLWPQAEDNEVQRLLTALRVQHNRLMELEKQVYESGLSVRQKPQQSVQRVLKAFKKLVKNGLAPVRYHGPFASSSGLRGLRPLERPCNTVSKQYIDVVVEVPTPIAFVKCAVSLCVTARSQQNITISWRDKSNGPWKDAASGFVRTTTYDPMLPFMVPWNNTGGHKFWRVRGTRINGVLFYEDGAAFAERTLLED